MAKVPKSIYLNEELNRVVDAISEISGATFTKLVTAALIKYVFDEYPRISPHWMVLTSGLERGTIPLHEVLLRCFENRSADINEVKGWLKKIANEDDPQKRNDWVRIYSSILESRNSDPETWREHFRKGDDNIKTIIEAIGDPKSANE